MSDTIVYRLQVLVGGAANALDGVDGNNLFGGELAFVHTSTKLFYVYQLNATSAQVESIPSIISPDNNPGDKRWELLATINQSVLLPDTDNSHNLILDCGENLSADRILSLILGDAARTLTLSGSTTLGGTASNAEAIAGTDTVKIVPAAGLAAAQAVLVNPKAMSQGVAMTYAASGSSGIKVADNDNIDFGTGNFTLVWRGSLLDWTPSADQILLIKFATVGYALTMFTAGKIGVGGTIAKTATGANTFGDGTVHTIVASITRGGNVVFYFDGSLFETLSGVNTTDLLNTGVFEVAGRSATGVRTASTTHFAATYNRALTAAEVLDLNRNGVAPQHRRASQTALTSGTLLAGQEYTIDTFVAGDDFSNIATVVSGTINTTGCIFVATGTTPTTWTNSSSLRATGATLILEPEGIQPAPGQWLDSSTNKLHAMQPATGSSLTRYKKDFEYRWTNTWTASSAAQYVGGLNQAVLSADHFITDVITQATVTTDVENLTLGDGSDADRFVTAFAPSATRTKQTIAAQSDGTNLKLVYTPAAEATMTVETIIRGFIWEP